MVSPSFELLGRQYKLTAHSAGNNFAKSRGRGVVSLKLLESCGPGEELTLEFSIQVGGTTYGPVCHNFAEKAKPPESPQKAANDLSKPILLVVRNVTLERNAYLHFSNNRLKSALAGWVKLQMPAEVEDEAGSTADTEVSHEDNNEDPSDEPDITEDVHHQAPPQQLFIPSNPKARWSEEDSDDEQVPQTKKTPIKPRTLTRHRWADQHTTPTFCWDECKCGREHHKALIQVIDWEDGEPVEHETLEEGNVQGEEGHASLLSGTETTFQTERNGEADADPHTEGHEDDDMPEQGNAHEEGQREAQAEVPCPRRRRRGRSEAGQRRQLERRENHFRKKQQEDRL